MSHMKTIKMTGDDYKDCLTLQGIDPGIGLFRHFTKDIPRQIEVKEIREEDQSLRKLKLKVLIDGDELLYCQAKGMARQSDKGNIALASLNRGLPMNK